jgi:deoxyribose-phosphate aldolase
MNKYFDHTILKPDATKEAVLQVVEEAKQYNLASVCVNQYRTKMVADLLKGTDVKVCTVIGFPLGAVDTKVKVFETTQAISDGAEEIDMVINIGAMKDGDYEYVREEIRAIKDACKDNVLKVIIETCLLTEEEIVKACELAVEAGADFVKTSTGFSTGGATAEAVALMKQTVGTQAKVKASGGIRDLERAKAMVEAGADRIGASKLLV